MQKQSEQLHNKGAIGPFVVLEDNELKNLTIHLVSLAPLEFYRGEQPRLPALEMLVSRGRATTFKVGGESTIFTETALEKISFAQQRLAGEESQPKDCDSGYWYCADPVYLMADRDQVVLSHPTSIHIQESEADALIDAFNQLFKEDGIQLWRDVGCAERWYLRSDRPWHLTTTPLDQTEGRSIRELMPQGDDALRWRKVIAELEMLFFANPVNQKRSEKGELIISGIWLWGEQIIESAGSLPWELLVGENPLLKGARSLQGITQKSLPDSLEEMIDTPSNTLIVIDELLQHQRSGTFSELPQLLLDLEQKFFAPALVALRQGRIKELTIQPANGSIYKIKRHDLMWFWRSIKRVWYEG